MGAAERDPGALKEPLQDRAGNGDVCSFVTAFRYFILNFLLQSSYSLSSKRDLKIGGANLVSVSKICV